MITFISGVPGSGKTYLAVTYMQKETKPICTNIEIKKEIKFNVFVWKDFYRKIKLLYKYKESSNKAIKLAKRINLYNIAIYYDECHLEMGSQDKIVIWWLSWHRHLDQTIYLITQSKGTLAQKYRAYPEIFLDAHPATKRIFGSVMRYTEFASYKMSKDDVIRKFSIKIDPKIFEIYRTGATNKGVNSLRKKLYMIVALFFVPIIAFWYIFNRFSPDVKEPTNEDSNITKIVKIIPKVKINKKILVEISGKWVNYKGWLFNIEHPLVKEMLAKPHKTHSVSKGYHRLKYDRKFISFFDVMIANRGF